MSLDFLYLNQFPFNRKKFIGKLIVEITCVTPVDTAIIQHPSPGNAAIKIFHQAAPWTAPRQPIDYPLADQVCVFPSAGHFHDHDWRISPN